MKKNLLLIVAVLLFFKIANAQQDPIHIAIIPFTSPGYNDGDRDIVQNEVASCFADKNRFFLLDRDATDALKKELEAAKDNTSIYAKVVAQQGHQAQAEFIITGVLDPLVMGTTTTTNYFTKATTTQYHGTLHLALQIYKVETGRVFKSIPIAVTSSDYATQSNSDIMDNALCKLKSEVQNIVRELFPASIEIVRVEKEKKGLPEEVLVNAGSDVFDNGKKSVCSQDKFQLGNLLSRKKIMLEVFTVTEDNIAGKVYEREKIIGVLKVESVEEELSVCEVVSGAQEIKDMLDNKKIPEVRLQKN